MLHDLVIGYAWAVALGIVATLALGIAHARRRDELDRRDAANRTAQLREPGR